MNRALFPCLAAALCLGSSRLWAQEAPDFQADSNCRRQIGTMPPLHWIEPSEAEDRRILSRWCATVGPAAWWAPHTAHAADADDSLVVVSWNVHVGGGDIEAFVDSLHQGRLTAGRPVRDFVLLLQEVFRHDPTLPDITAADPVPARIAAAPPGGVRRDIVETAEKLRLWLFYVPSMRNGAPVGGDAEDRGNAILSTLPLRKLGAVELPFVGQRRVALLAEVSGTHSGRSWRLQFCNVHLDNRARGVRVFAGFGSGRLRQAQFLLRILPLGPLITGGDLNTWMPATLERARLLLAEAFLAATDTDLPPTYSRKLLPDRRTDYLFFRIAVPVAPSVCRVDNRFGSDHHAVLAWISRRELARDAADKPAAGSE